MTTEHKLQLELNRIIYPEINDRLKFGCKIEVYSEEFDGHWQDGYITDVYGGGQIADTGDYSDWCCMANIETGWGSKEIDIADFYEDENECRIIGLPITLELVLKSLETKIPTSKPSFSNGRIWYSEFGKAAIWNLTEPYSNQPQPTKDALLKVFNVT